MVMATASDHGTNKEFLFHGWMMGKALNTAKEALQLGEVILGHQRLINWVRINISA